MTHETKQSVIRIYVVLDGEGRLAFRLPSRDRVFRPSMVRRIEWWKEPGSP